jgi:hypothetical protein
LALDPGVTQRLFRCQACVSINLHTSAPHAQQTVHTCCQHLPRQACNSKALPHTHACAQGAGPTRPFLAPHQEVDTTFVAACWVGSGPNSQHTGQASP